MEASQQQFPAAEMERMMKIQEVVLKAMAGKLKWWEAAEIIGVTDRTMRRWRQSCEEHGYSGLYDRRKRRPSPKRVPVEDLEQVLHLYREKYFDFNVQHFHEKLREEHGIHYSYTWVKTALQDAGLVKRRKKRGTHRKRRPRRPLPGMMLHIDASDHRWFAGEQRWELLVIMDDATSEIYYAQLVEAESTRAVMAEATGSDSGIEPRGSATSSLLQPSDSSGQITCELDRTGHILTTGTILRVDIWHYIVYPARATRTYGAEGYGSCPASWFVRSNALVIVRRWPESGGPSMKD